MSINTKPPLEGGKLGDFPRLGRARKVGDSEKCMGRGDFVSTNSPPLPTYPVIRYPGFYLLEISHRTTLILY